MSHRAVNATTPVLAGLCMYLCHSHRISPSTLSPVSADDQEENMSDEDYGCRARTRNHHRAWRSQQGDQGQARARGKKPGVTHMESVHAIVAALLANETETLRDYVGYVL